MNKDLKFGCDLENLIKPLLENKFNVSLNKTHRYCKVDFINQDKKIIFELKGRKCNKLQYNDTMIGLNKVLYCIDKLKDGYRVLFVFSFLDKNCYYELTENINTDWIREGGRYDRGRPEINKYYYIPVSELIDF